MSATVTPLPVRPKLWVIDTPDGMDVVDYVPNSKALVGGPFVSRATANWWIEIQRMKARESLEHKILVVVALLSTVAPVLYRLFWLPWA